MKTEIAEKISSEIALEFLNQITRIHNLLCASDEKEAFFVMGQLVEQLAQRIR